MRLMFIFVKNGWRLPATWCSGRSHGDYWFFKKIQDSTIHNCRQGSCNYAGEAGSESFQQLLQLFGVFDPGNIGWKGESVIPNLVSGNE